MAGIISLVGFMTKFLTNLFWDSPTTRADFLTFQNEHFYTWKTVGGNKLNTLKEGIKNSKWLSRIYWSLVSLKDRIFTDRFRICETQMTGYRLFSYGNTPTVEASVGIFDNCEVEFMKEQMRACDTFVDVGANIGYYTALAKSLGKPVVAVEPQPKNLSLLCKMLLVNGWQATEVIPTAVSNKVGTMTLYGDSSNGSSLIRDWGEGQNFSCKQVVPVNTLDNLFAGRFDGKRLFIKIDVEGVEYSVIKGAMALLARTVKPVWFVEIANEDTREDIFRIFKNAGYEAKQITHFNWRFV
jgi:FkbM family methyltransferase